MSTKITKDELKSPDQITKTLCKGFVWTTAHSNIVIGTASIFILFGLGISVTGYLHEKKEVTQQEKYFVLEKTYTEIKRGIEESARADVVAAQTAKGKNPTPPVSPGKKASGDLQTDYGAVIAGFDTLVNEVPKTKAAQMAALNLSDIYLTYKKGDDALTALQKIEKDLDKDDMISGLVWMQIGNILANKGDCKAAIEKWAALSKAKSLAFVHDEAKLRMGLCYESMNDVAKAESIYTEVAQKNATATTDMAVSREAQKYLRLLKAKKNL